MTIFKDNNSIIQNLFEGELTYLYIISSIISLSILGFAIRNFYLENYLLATLLSIYVVYSAIAAYFLTKDSSQQKHLNICVVFLLASLCCALFEWGVTSAYWFYPVVVGLVFIVPPRISMASNALVLTAVSYIAITELSIIEAIRLIIALFITVVMSYLIRAHVNKLHNKIQEESITDPLTGALNRRQLDVHLTQSRHSFEREQKPACILMLDLDHFKSINDKFSHDVGDQVIINLVEVIQTHCRKQDLLFRIGGEEFVLLLPNTAQQDAIVVASKIKNYLNSANILATQQVTVSIGIAELNNSINSTEAWLKVADDYLYQAKNTGRDRVCYHLQVS